MSDTFDIITGMHGSDLLGGDGDKFIQTTYGDDWGTMKGGDDALYVFRDSTLGNTYDAGTFIKNASQAKGLVLDTDDILGFYQQGAFQRLDLKDEFGNKFSIKGDLEGLVAYDINGPGKVELTLGAF